MHNQQETVAPTPLKLIIGAKESRLEPRSVRGRALLLVHRAALCGNLNLHYVTASAQRTIIFYIFFTIIAGELLLYVQQWLDMT